MLPLGRVWPTERAWEGGREVGRAIDVLQACWFPKVTTLTASDRTERCLAVFMIYFIPVTCCLKITFIIIIRCQNFAGKTVSTLMYM